MVFLTYPVELLLQFLICIIYTELLETVAVKSLEPARQEDTRHRISVSRQHVTASYRSVSNYMKSTTLHFVFGAAKLILLTRRCPAPL